MYKYFYSKFLLIVILTIGWFSSGHLTAQNKKFDQLSIKEGLSYDVVNCILQDQLGFIWIGTGNGLNVYDGYEVKTFYNSPDDPHSLAGNSITDMAEDPYGNIWLATIVGLNVYHRKTGKFELLGSDTNDSESIPLQGITQVFVDSKGIIWVASNGILYEYHNEEKKVTQHKINKGRIAAITEDLNGKIWVGAERGLSALSRDRKSITSYIHEPDNEFSLSSNDIRSLYADENALWIGTFRTGLDRFAFDNKFTHFRPDPKDNTSLSNEYVWGINKDKSGRLWVATDVGLSIMNLDGKTFEVYLEGTASKDIKSSTTTCVLFDFNERAWIGTRRAGVHIYDEDTYKFQLFEQNESSNSIPNNKVISFEEDQLGNIYIGTDGGGLSYFDRKTGKFTNYVYDEKKPGGLVSDKVLALEIDNNGNLWIGTWAEGVQMYNPQTKTYTNYKAEPDNPNSLSDNNIFDFLEDSKGNIWIGTWGNGFTKFDPVTNSFTQYPHDPDNPNTFGSSPVVYMIEDHEGNIWLGSEGNGVYVFDPINEILKNYSTSDETGSLSYDEVYSLYQDKKNRIWVGTTGGGLNLFQPETETFKVYRKNDGLPSDAIVGILEDGHGNLWLSTVKGLCKFNPDSITYKNYDVKDGLQGNQFNRWAVLKLSSGEMLFGGNNGFNLFDPDQIKPNKFIPPVYITDFKLFNKEVPIGENEVLKQHILFTKTIDLEYSQNVFSFEYVALNYRQPEKNQYEYKLEGFDEQWVKGDEGRKAVYTNLSPGEYVFRVRASNNDGIWNEEGTSLNIIVIPPFWMTKWFIGVVSISIILGVIFYIRRQKIRAKQEQKKLERIIEEQTSEVKKQSAEILEKVKKEEVANWITKGLAHFGNVMSKHKNSLKELSQETLKNLVNYVGASQGTFAIALKDDPQDEHLSIEATYGVNEERLSLTRIEIGSGLLGATYKDKEIKLLENIPEDYVKIESGLGEGHPSTLVLFPLQTDDGEVHGVVELAFINPVSEVSMQFLKEVCGIVALNVNATILNQKTMVLLQRSKEQTEELRAQEEEMRQNMEELEATQEELRRREDAILKNNTELKEIQEKMIIREKELKEKINHLEEELRKYQNQ